MNSQHIDIFKYFFSFFFMVKYTGKDYCLYNVYLIKEEFMRKLRILLLLFLSFFWITGCSQTESSVKVANNETIQISNIPEYTNQPYIEINNNIPDFSESEKTAESFEFYSELDKFGRCGYAMANISKDLMPTTKRESIGMIKPTGWKTVRYDDLVDGKYLYNRCHLIGYQLAGENANEKNLITGTRYMNVEGMLPFENKVADYVNETNNHVLYRVTPVFEGENLVASGVQMEAYSIEDKGQGVSFNVFVYNVQPGVTIDYATGDSHRSEEISLSKADDEEIEIRGNKSSKIYHCPGQAAYDDMKDSKNLVIFHSEKEAQNAGYRKAYQC